MVDGHLCQIRFFVKPILTTDFISSLSPRFDATKSRVVSDIR